MSDWRVFQLSSPGALPEAGGDTAPRLEGRPLVRRLLVPRSRRRQRVARRLPRRLAPRHLDHVVRLSRHRRHHRQRVAVLSAPRAGRTGAAADEVVVDTGGQLQLRDEHQRHAVIAAR